MNSLLPATSTSLWLTGRTTGAAGAGHEGANAVPVPTAQENTTAASPSSAPTTASTTSATTTSSQTSPGRSARAALDAQAAQAAKVGLSIVYDTAQLGRTPDMRGLDPEQLAAIANGADARFSHDEKIWAQAELAGRVGRTLEGLDGGDPGDMRAYNQGVKTLYGQMSPEVRQALGWTPAMLAECDKLISWGEAQHGKVDKDDFWERFLEGLRKDGAYRPSRVDLRT